MQRRTIRAESRAVPTVQSESTYPSPVGSPPSASGLRPLPALRELAGFPSAAPSAWPSPHARHTAALSPALSVPSILVASRCSCGRDVFVQVPSTLSTLDESSVAAPRSFPRKFGEVVVAVVIRIALWVKQSSIPRHASRATQALLSAITTIWIRFHLTAILLALAAWLLKLGLRLDREFHCAAKLAELIRWTVDALTRVLLAVTTAERWPQAPEEQPTGTPHVVHLPPTLFAPAGACATPHFVPRAP